MLRILDAACGTAHRTLVFRQLLFPIPVLVLHIAAFGADTVLLHLDLLGLFLSGLYSTVQLGELLLTKTQFFCPSLDVEPGLCHQELVPAGGTGNRTGQFVGQLVDTCRDGTALAAQLVQTSGKVAQLAVYLLQPRLIACRLFLVLRAEIGVILFELFPCRTFLRQRPFGVLDRSVEVVKRGTGDFHILLFEPEGTVPVRAPCVRKERHKLFDGFQALFQRGVRRFQLLQRFVRLPDFLHHPVGFVRRLFPGTYLFPFGGDGGFELRNAGCTGAPALFARRRLAVDLLL